MNMVSGIVEMFDAFVETQAGYAVETSAAAETEAEACHRSVPERVQEFEKAANTGVGDGEPDAPVGVLFANVLDGLVQMWHQKQRNFEQERERERRLLQDKERRLLYPNDIQFSAQRTHR